MIKIKTTNELYDIVKSISCLMAKQYHCTFNETEKITSILSEHYKAVRECKEYDTIEDFIKGNKAVDIGEEIISVFGL